MWNIREIKQMDKYNKVETNPKTLIVKWWLQKGRSKGQEGMVERG